MSKKHFISAAEIISKIENINERHQMAKINAIAFSKQNPRFDYDWFYKACNCPEMADWITQINVEIVEKGLAAGLIL